MKKLAIIGASYLQMPLVLKAKEMGIETHCFAWEERAVCKDYADYFYPVSVTDKETILEKCVAIEIDGITSIASDVAVPTICYIADKMQLLSNDYQDAINCTNKYEMRKRFESHKVSGPKFSYVTNGFDISGFNYPLIVKPTDRSGSRGVMKVYNYTELTDAVERAKSESFAKQAIIEEYIAGVEISVETISWKGTHYILAITDKVTTGGPYFVELEYHQPSALSSVIQEKIKLETIKALDALNIKYGASHSEFKITENGNVYVIEVGARMGGDFIGSNLVELSTGFDFLKGVIEIALREFNKPVISKNLFSGVYFLSAETKYLFDIIQHQGDYPEIIDSELTNAEIKPIQCSADRSGYLIYQSDSHLIFKNSV